MNIHEHQAKEILKEFGAPTTEGVVIYDTNNLSEKIKVLDSEQLVLKAQIHAGGRGKAGGVKLVKRPKILEEAKKLFHMTPFHHHFELKGFPESRIVIRFWIVGLLLALLTLTTFKIR